MAGPQVSLTPTPSTYVNYLRSDPGTLRTEGYKRCLILRTLDRLAALAPAQK